MKERPASGIIAIARKNHQEEEIKAFLEYTAWHHRSLSYGNFVQELRELAEICGIRHVLDA